MKKTIILILFINITILQADNEWIWAEEKQHAVDELEKKKQDIADAEAKLKEIENQTDTLRKI